MSSVSARQVVVVGITNGDELAPMDNEKPVPLPNTQELILATYRHPRKTSSFDTRDASHM